MEPKVELMLNIAEKFIGLPYVWGASTPLVGFDCSGLICELFHSVGMLPTNFRTNSQGLYEKFSPISEKDKRVAGALAFYGPDLKNIKHIAMLLSSDLIIEAGGGGRNSVDLQSAIKEDAYVRVRPLNHRKDLLAVIKPKY